MIRLAENIDDLRVLCADSPFGCQILSAAEAYGLERRFAQFWTDSSAAYGKLDGVMRICGEITDAEEVVSFLHAVGAQSVVCSAENAEKLGLDVTERGVVLYKDLEHTAPVNVNREDISPSKVYEVLKSCDMVGEFEPFYLDLSHRVRHNCAMCAAERTGEEITAVGVVTIGDACSLISAVGVRPEYHRKGLGTKLVRRMEERLSGRVYLLRAENENERFYAQLGYTPCGAWCTGNLR